MKFEVITINKIHLSQTTPSLTLLHLERPKLHRVLTVLSAKGLNRNTFPPLTLRYTVKILNIGTCMSEQTV